MSFVSLKNSIYLVKHQNATTKNTTPTEELLRKIGSPKQEAIEFQALFKLQVYYLPLIVHYRNVVNWIGDHFPHNVTWLKHLWLCLRRRLHSARDSKKCVALKFTHEYIEKKEWTHKTDTCANNIVLLHTSFLLLIKFLIFLSRHLSVAKLNSRKKLGTEKILLNLIRNSILNLERSPFTNDALTN